MCAEHDRYQQVLDFFGPRAQRHAPLAAYTSARVGGPADVLLTVRDPRELALAARHLWNWGLPFWVLGGGSNVLIADQGVRGVVVLNRARQATFYTAGETPTLWAASGANLGSLARRAAQQGLAGLEWAVGIPGTVGGAVVGNAGAHGRDTAAALQLAEILHKEEGRRRYTPQDLGMAYRTSRLKTRPQQAVVLSATFRLQKDKPQDVQARLEAFNEQRKRTQPPGASMGSMFKNPPGDYAGRLIEAAGLKGATVGDAEISTVHANFFLNKGQATAQHIWALMYLARTTVAQKFGVWLEPEIQLLGAWPPEAVYALYEEENLPPITPLPRPKEAA